MKNNTFFIAILLFISSSSSAQMTLVHTFPKQFQTESEIVNLSLSGKKIMTLTSMGAVGMGLPDTIYFYNLDYSLWKMIPCPGIPGYTGIFNFFHDASNPYGVFYPSETLFNTDPLLEVAVFYEASPFGKFLIINETGTIVDSILDATNSLSSGFRVFKVDTLGIGFQAAVTTSTGIKIYNLPGTLPCDACEHNYGLAYEQSILGTDQTTRNSINTAPLPNPSSNQVKITFTLPDGVTQGELDLYNTEGQKIKSFQVDNRFGYILLDNTRLPAGLYFYNIVANGTISATQKLVVIK